MSRIIATIVMLAWALWFGGMIALMIFVIRLFNTSREIGIATAPILFRSFANYQIAIGLLAAGAGTFLTLITRRNAHAILSLLMIVTLAAAIVVRGWTFEMERLRLSGQLQSVRFQSLHNRSSMLYSSEAILLLIAGVGWMLTFPPPRRADEIAAA
ncbi:MAG TPA: hypothetical protein VGF52_02195 [Tepidisphaeraceae bacterium]